MARKCDGGKDPRESWRDYHQWVDSLFTRAPEHDRRIRRGDDSAGDAWRDRKSGNIRYVAVGHDPNAKKD